MDFHKRDFFIQRIMSGILLYEYQDKVLEIRAPTLSIKHRSALIYQKHYKECKEAGVLTEEEALDYLRFVNKWSDEEEHLFNTEIPKAIENTKVKLYLSESIPSQRKMAERILKELRKEFDILAKKRSQLSHNICKTAAMFAQKEYEIRHSTFLDDKKYDWDCEDIRHAVSFVYNNSISDSNMRELARSTPWSNYLNANKYTSDLFGVPASQLTDEQIVLLSWTSLYENIRESHEPPPSSVIENDDMLDGWLINQKREEEKRKEEEAKEKKQVDVNNDKISKADEVFILSKPDPTSATGYRPIGPDDVAGINSMNSPHAEVLKRSRLKQVIEQGSVNHNDLYDVKQDINIQKAKLFREKMKASK